MSIITYKSLFERCCRVMGGSDPTLTSKRLKFQTDGAPTVVLAYTSEDWGMASPAADALAGCGVDIYADWSSAQLFEGFNDEAALRLGVQLGLGDSWLVALVSERTPLTGPIPWVLELAREALPSNRFAVLPVHVGDGEWTLPEVYQRFPRIEEQRDDLCVTGPGSDAPLPLRRWFRVTANG